MNAQTRTTVKRAIKTAFASPLGWRTLGVALRAPGVIVLTYHRIVGAEPSLPGISVAHFAAQMKWIRENCEPIGPDALVERSRAPRRVRPAVLVTFDDGYRSYHDLAYPVLKQYDIPALNFVVTSLLDEPGMLWTDRVQWAALTTPRTSVCVPWMNGGAWVPLPDRAARESFGLAARTLLKTVPNALRAERVEEIVAMLGGAPPRERQMTNWEEVRRTMDLTTYGGHTHTHAILSRLDREDAAREIRACRDRLAAETGRAPLFFAYPNGTQSDFTAETQHLLRESGFQVSFSTIDGIAGAATDWMAVRRIASIDADVSAFVWIAAGLAS
ncbi:MAG TPA: polysaccharide deacetylase family protein [Polyangia bacterium]|nr:polysaccharide deacetylase family protein [Polyangia bacterium]